MTTRPELPEHAAPKPSDRIQQIMPQMVEQMATLLRRESGVALTDQQWAELRKDGELKEKVDDAAFKAGLVVVLDELHARIRKLEGPTKSEFEAALATIQGVKTP